MRRNALLYAVVTYTGDWTSVVTVGPYTDEEVAQEFAARIVAERPHLTALTVPLYSAFDARMTLLATRKGGDNESA